MIEHVSLDNADVGDFIGYKLGLNSFWGACQSNDSIGWILAEKSKPLVLGVLLKLEYRRMREPYSQASRGTNNNVRWHSKSLTFV